LHQRPTLPTHEKDIEIVVTDDGSRTLRQVSTGVTWHSESGALAESELVFLQNSNAALRLLNGQFTQVLEIGFGTGLNFWITASVAMRHKTPLNYVSIEPHLLRKNLTEMLQHGDLEACQPGYRQFYESIFEQRFESQNMQPVSFKRFSALEQFLPTHDSDHKFDAVFHDPFSPEVIPELWSEAMFTTLRSMMAPSARLVTYCVKSSIQKNLKNAGFRVEKTRGPVGGKREVLIAHNDVS